MINYLFYVLSLFCIKANNPNPVSSHHFTIQPLADGVWAAIQDHNGGYAIGNAGIIDLGDKTLVFDAFINIHAAEDLKRTAEELTGHPVTIVVNSHYHDDHVRGNQVFEGAEIISTASTKEAMAVSEPEERANAIKTIEQSIAGAARAYDAAPAADKKEAALWLNYYKAIADGLKELKLVLPNKVFTDSIVIRGTKRTVVLKEYKNGHTASDAVLMLRSEGIAFMGDMFFVQHHPFIAEGDPQKIREYLSAFYADRSFDTFVPGHGPVAGKSSLQQMINYVSHIQNRVSEAVNTNQPDSVFYRQPMPAAYHEWSLKRFYTINLSVLKKRAKK